MSKLMQKKLKPAELEQQLKKMKDSQGELLKKSLSLLQECSLTSDLVKKIQPILNKIAEIQQVYNQKLLPLVQSYRINGFNIASFSQEFVPVVASLVLSNQDSSFRVFVKKICNSVQALLNLQFQSIEPEFFQMLNINQKNVVEVQQFLISFQQTCKAPIQQLNQKANDALNYIVNRSTNSGLQQMFKMKEKLEKSEGLSHKDMFKLADLSDNGSLDMREFKLYFKKLGFMLSDHRVKEIFAFAKQNSGVVGSKEQTLNEQEFEKAYDYIQRHSIFLTLEQLGITKERLMFGLIWLTILLLLIFAFIFVGVTAFTLPGTFGSIINSMFPVAGGGGLSKGNQKDQKKILDLEKLKAIVAQSIDTIQSAKI